MVQPNLNRFRRNGLLLSRRQSMCHSNNNFSAAALASVLAFFGLAACTRTSPSRLEASQSQASGVVSAIGFDATEAQIQKAGVRVRVGRIILPTQLPNGAHDAE